MKTVTLVGRKFGRLTVLEFSRIKDCGKYKLSLWKCRCDCGTVVESNRCSLVTGRTRSCGCLHREKTVERFTTHGMSGGRHGKRPRIYRIWQGMVARCTCPKHMAWPDYGGRGITVCKRWRKFENFHADMGPSYSPLLTLDRRDNNRSYTPKNCHWATRVAQDANRSNNVFLVHDGKKFTVSRWARELNIPLDRIRGRMALGWSAKETLTRPSCRASSRLP